MAQVKFLPSKIVSIPLQQSTINYKYCCIQSQIFTQSLTPPCIVKFKTCSATRVFLCDSEPADMLPVPLISCQRSMLCLPASSDRRRRGTTTVARSSCFRQLLLQKGTLLVSRASSGKHTVDLRTVPEIKSQIGCCWNIKSLVRVQLLDRCQTNITLLHKNVTTVKKIDSIPFDSERSLTTFEELENTPLHQIPMFDMLTMGNLVKCDILG